MTPHRPGDLPGPFSPAELLGVPDVAPDELVADRQVARRLEAAAESATVRPSPDFADRVMAAIAAEPAPAPVRAAGAALRRGSLAAFLAAFRDAWRVSFGSGFPVAARAQALVLVLVAGGVLAGSGVVTAGALGAFNRHGSEPAPTTPATAAPTATSEPTATPEPPESAGPSGTIEPVQSGSPEPSESAANEPTDAPAPAATPNSTAGEGGSGSNETHAVITPRPTRSADGTPQATPTPWPTHEGEDHGSPAPSLTPQASEVPPTGFGPTPTPGH
jgi:hypothetical protein